MHAEEAYDEIFSELLQEAEEKINQRVRQKFNLLLIQNQVERYLFP